MNVLKTSLLAIGFLIISFSCQKDKTPISIDSDNNPKVIPPKDSLDLYGSYDTFIYNDNNLLTTIGTLSFSPLDSITIVTTDSFINVIDTLGVADYLPDNTYICKIMNDSLEFITTYFPNFGFFLMKGYYSNDTIRGDWELWGHIAPEETGPFEALKTE